MRKLNVTYIWCEKANDVGTNYSRQCAECVGYSIDDA